MNSSLSLIDKRLRWLSFRNKTRIGENLGYMVFYGGKSRAGTFLGRRGTFWQRTGNKNRYIFEKALGRSI